MRSVRHLLSRVTHRLHTMPVLVLMPHSRCNCRCVMCDIWKANRNGTELSAEALAPHLEAIESFGVQRVVLSGGEPLMHSNLWRLCEHLRALGTRITLLSTGLLLKRHAAEVTHWCDDVIVSLDGSRDVHDRIRDVPGAFEKLAGGVAALKEITPAMPVAARCVIQRLNYFDLPGIVEAARDMGLDQISFLAADVFSTAFNRPEPWPTDRASEIALTAAEASAFEQIVERLIADRPEDFASGFIAESPEKLRRLPAYFRALNGDGEFPPNRCNAPWVSAVVEADGEVRPCFFHPSFGNLHEAPMDELLNGDAAVDFRRRLDVRDNPICRKCVCTLNLRPWGAV